ncbi:RNA-binding family protein with RRM/RBD/RNP motifs [Prunus dulcis]|uniref:RNA-binding family protein with RRM/RBD/RNP motifs n=1 Tax=Prunus dulcis TaxID=3755 RepID=A0A4Y1RD51_PRUDU|nr:RNA-binding family protein with RRM/RBD/RNP motifs [Prunus dulcis]
MWLDFYAVTAKVIRNKQTALPEGYGFIEFRSRSAAEQILQQYNGTLMPNTEQNFRLNWATLGAGERRQDDGPDFTVFVGDLAADVTDYLLQETFRAAYHSVKGAKVVTDRTTGRSKGYGFVRFGDEGEQLRAMTEMNGQYCSTRPMRIGPAATKKPASGGQQYQKASYPSTQEIQARLIQIIQQWVVCPNVALYISFCMIIFVGGLDPSVNDDMLRQVFSQFGELVHVKIPVGKRCGFVQFGNRSCAEQALGTLNGTQLGGQSIRLSWGRSPTSKQNQPDQAQWNGGGGGYYGYPQGYDAYTYAPPAQDPNLYYGGYHGYGNYQQPGAYQQQQQLPALEAEAGYHHVPDTE